MPYCLTTSWKRAVNNHQTWCRPKHPKYTGLRCFALFTWSCLLPKQNKKVLPDTLGLRSLPSLDALQTHPACAEPWYLEALGDVSSLKAPLTTFT